MTLIDTREDDKALLELEDQAIRDADKETAEPTVPTGGELAKLIEDLTSDPAPVHQG